MTKLEIYWRFLTLSRKILFLDTGPLLLLFLGMYDKKLIGSKRLEKYDDVDFDILVQFIRYRKIYTTCGVLAETSNFSKQKIKKKKFYDFIEKIREELEKLDETFVPKNKIIKSEKFSKLGYADTSIVIAAKTENGEVLTGDWPLYSVCENLGIKATHLDELKEYRDILE